METDPEPFIISFSSDYPLFIDLMKKYANYINELVKDWGIPFFLEIINDGFLFIMKDFESFRLFRNPDYLEEKLVLARNDIAQGGNWPKIIEPLQIPETGITWWINFNTGDADQIFSIIEDNFHQVHPDIETRLIDAKSCSVFFKTPELFLLYERTILFFLNDLEQNQEER